MKKCHQRKTIKLVSKAIRIALLLLCYSLGINSVHANEKSNYHDHWTIQVSLEPSIAQDTIDCMGEDGRCPYPTEESRKDSISGDTLVILAIESERYAPWRQFRYRLQCDTSWIESEKLPETSISIDSLSPGQYFWAAKQGCPEVGESGWSDCSSFSIGEEEEEEFTPTFDCPAPDSAALGDSMLSPSSVQLNCQLAHFPRWYEFSFHMPGDTAWTSSGQQSENYFVLDSLEEAEYEWRVRIGCSEIGSSAWSDTLNFSLEMSTAIRLGNDLEWSISPNPAHSRVRISLPSEFQQPETKIWVIDLNGRVVRTWNAGYQNELSLSSIDAGLYTVVVSLDDLFLRKKLVVLSP